MTITDLQSDLQSQEENSGWIRPAYKKMMDINVTIGKVAQLVNHSESRELVGADLENLRTQLQHLVKQTASLANNYDVQIDLESVE